MNLLAAPKKPPQPKPAPAPAAPAAAPKPPPPPPTPPPAAATKTPPPPPPLPASAAATTTTGAALGDTVYIERSPVPEDELCDEGFERAEAADNDSLFHIGLRGGMEVLQEGGIHNFVYRFASYQNDTPGDHVYERLCMEDNDDWLELLRDLRTRGEKFTDPEFPPTEKALYCNAAAKRDDFSQTVTQWRRISDMFAAPISRFVTFVFFGNAEGLCGGYMTHSREKFDAVGDNSAAASTSVKDQLPRHQARLVELLTLGFGEDPAAVQPLCHGKMGPGLTGVLPKLARSVSPLEFSRLGEVKFNVAGKPGYVPQIRVTAELIFQTTPALFEKSEDEENFIAPGDVRQGGLGSCYFLGALSVLSTDEGRLFDIFPDIPDELRVEELGGEEGEQQYNVEGIYAVRFFREGKWHNVIVDDYIPCNARGMASFAQPPLTGAEVWAMLAEKAYAKLNGGCVACAAAAAAASAFTLLIHHTEAHASRHLTTSLPRSLLPLTDPLSYLRLASLSFSFSKKLRRNCRWSRAPCNAGPHCWSAAVV